MRSKEQVDEDIKKCVKIVITYEQKEESTIVENDIHFEIPPAEVGLLTKRTCRV